jgi:pimeloyl-ACP methyl ester carboxylesterase
MKPITFLLAILILAAPIAGRGQSIRGSHEGVDYLINRPAEWRGGLVLFAHGYEGEGAGRGSLASPTIERHLARRNVAWAASGYRSKGYRPDWFLADTLALRELFISLHGKPRWSVIHGQSLGGYVAVAALELHPDAFQGGLLECGVIDGVGQLDWHYAYTAAAEYFSGLPLLETPRPAFDKLTAEFISRMGRPRNYTESGERFDNVIKHLAGGDLPYRPEGLNQRYTSILNPRDPGPDYPREYARHADTRQIEYDIDHGFGIDKATLNRQIRRIIPPPGARSREANPVFAPFTGKLSAPLIAVHETADFLVPFRLQQDYRRRTIEAGKSHLLVQRAQRKAGHCGFEGKIREDAFDDLVAWIERGTVAAGDDVLGNPSKLGLRRLWH